MMSSRNGKRQVLTAKTQIALGALLIATLALAPAGGAKEEAGQTQSLGAPDPGRLDFLKVHDSEHAYLVDMNFVPPGPPLVPPWEPGLGQFVTISGVKSQIAVTNQYRVPGGFVGGLELSPDGDTAVMAGRGPVGNRLVVIRGLKAGMPAQTAIVPLPFPPLSFAVSQDGAYGVVGFDSFDGRARIGVIPGLPSAPALGAVLDLGVSGAAIGSVENLQFSHDNKNLLAHVLTLDSTMPPASLLPDASLVLIRNTRPGRTPTVASILDLPEDNPAIPPPPPLAGRPTGIAIGDSVLLCDGDSALVPVAGALGLAAPDARIHIVTGVSAGALRIARTLGPVDGVPPARAQAAVSVDCDRVIITRAFQASNIAVVSGLTDTSFTNLSIAVYPASYAGGPVEAAITADNQNVVAAHPRLPFNGTPPAATSNYTFTGGVITALGAPVVGPFRASNQVKDHLIQTFQPGLSDYVVVFTEGKPPGVRESLLAKIELAIKQADQGHDSSARHLLGVFINHVGALASEGRLSTVQAGVLTALAHVAIERLSPDFDLCLQDDDSGDLLRFNSLTGDYLFMSRHAGGFTLAGAGRVSRTGCLIELRDAMVETTLDRCPIAPLNRGRATIRRTPLGPTFVIVDSDTTNNTCAGR